MIISHPIRMWADAIVSLFFPRCCPICGRPLPKGDEVMCVSCNIQLPRTNYHLEKNNMVEKLFWGKIYMERVTSYFSYQKGCAYSEWLFRLKYKGEKELGEVLGRHIAAELIQSDFFEGIDVLVPIPLHPKRLLQRGYNQSEWIARGISVRTHIPIDTCSVAREKHTDSQIRKFHFERWENLEDVFSLRSPEAFVGKHVLLIDDVLTTGATIANCAYVLQDVSGIRISVLTLAVAQQ